MDLQNNYIKYYFYTKKRKINDIDILDSQIYKDIDKYHILIVSDEKYLKNNEIMKSYLLNKNYTSIYESGIDEIDNLFNDYISFSTIEDHDNSYIDLTVEEHLLSIDKTLVIKDLNDMIDKYFGVNNAPEYDCIEVLFPKIDGIYYELDFVEEIKNILDTRLKVSLDYVYENGYKLIYSNENSININLEDDWIIVPAGPSSWNMHAGLNPIILFDQDDGKFIRFQCIRSENNEDGFETAAIKSKKTYYDGRFECEARFKGASTSWPAIWMSHPNGAQNNYETYYEVDISEYYEDRTYTNLTYHYPASMRKEADAISRKSDINMGTWNKFVCEWDDESIRVYVNNILIMKIENNNDQNYYPTTRELRSFQIILSMQYFNKILIENYGHVANLNDLPIWMDIRNIKIYEKI